MNQEFNEVKQYAYERVGEMPLVRAIEVKEETKVLIDVSEVMKKQYNGVLIGSAGKVEQILNEEYGAKAAACEVPGIDGVISISCEASKDAVKKTLNRVEAFVSSI